jgi:hypothetical protein
MRIVFTIDLPDGTDVAFADSIPPGPEGDRAAFDSLAPEFVPQQVIPPQPATPHVNPTCPNHHASKFVPAGISKRTGKEYKAFWGCTEMGCKWSQDAA